MHKKQRLILPFLVISLLTAACLPEEEAAPTAAPDTPASTATATVVETLTPTITPTPQPRLDTLVAYGPELEQFPSGVNPLTGLRVEHPELLDLPPVIVSISNMPATARPQAGTSFTPWIFELFIGEGASRFLGLYYGEIPRRIPNPPGACPVNQETFQSGETWIGNRVWLDENRDGRQDPWEAGVGGICADLLEAGRGEVLETTSTSSNGYYGFNLDRAGNYRVRFRIPEPYTFTTPNLGNDDEDSDADLLSGETQVFAPDGVETHHDAGLILTEMPPQTPSPADIAPERTYVGPIRSGRLTYNEIHFMFPNSCLVYASAGDGIRQVLEGCEIIFGENPEISPNTALLDTTRLLELAQESRVPNQPVNYSGNLISEVPPGGGQPAASLWTYYHSYTQALWGYDSLSGAYLRQTDDADGKGVFHPDSDRLTGRQLGYENVILLLAEYQRVRYLQYNVPFEQGLQGYAYLFRDGQVYPIRWSTANREWEKRSGMRRPVHFTDANHNPIPLKPGKTWICLMNLGSALNDLGDGHWQAEFAPPYDPRD
ncbi:MAG: DUF3048 C-terminal domain-containing protein [Anaerolineales bacterium]|nr:DUF3048 C-terminal domain-containing protein [Anaerolineales bacterium]